MRFAPAYICRPISRAMSAHLFFSPSDDPPIVLLFFVAIFVSDIVCGYLLVHPNDIHVFISCCLYIYHMKKYELLYVFIANRYAVARDLAVTCSETGVSSVPAGRPVVVVLRVSRTRDKHHNGGRNNQIIVLQRQIKIAIHRSRLRLL